MPVVPPHAGDPGCCSTARPTGRGAAASTLHRQPSPRTLQEGLGLCLNWDPSLPLGGPWPGLLAVHQHGSPALSCPQLWPEGPMADRGLSASVCPSLPRPPPAWQVTVSEDNEEGWRPRLQVGLQTCTSMCYKACTGGQGGPMLAVPNAPTCVASHAASREHEGHTGSPTDTDTHLHVQCHTPDTHTQHTYIHITSTHRDSPRLPAGPHTEACPAS